jgi:hypothetical protein
MTDRVAGAMTEYFLCQSFDRKKSVGQAGAGQLC